MKLQGIENGESSIGKSYAGLSDSLFSIPYSRII
jgi:hypothetical protein